MAYEFEVAEETVKLSLSGLQVAASIAGDAAERLLRIVYLILSGDGKKEQPIRNRLKTILREGRELKLFSIRDRDINLFTADAEKYGIECYYIKDKDRNDGITEIIADSLDAKKINRIFENNGIRVPDRNVRMGKPGADRAAATAPAREPPQPGPPVRERKDTALKEENAIPSDKAGNQQGKTAWGPEAKAPGKEDTAEICAEEKSPAQKIPEKVKEKISGCTDRAPDEREKSGQELPQKQDNLPQSIRTRKIPGIDPAIAERLDDIIERKEQELRNSRRYNMPKRQERADSVRT